MILINGIQKNTIDCSDRGLQYGDGLFETLAVFNSKLRLVDAHLARLASSCKRLQINCPDLSLLKIEIEQVKGSSKQAVIKIIVTRGFGGRGYRLPEAPQVNRIISLHPYPEYPVAFAEQGIRARICTLKLGINPMLAGIKHLNRLEQVLARAEWQDSAIQEGIMLDIQGRVIEGTMTNLFMVKDEKLITAPITDSGVAGIIRHCIIILAKMHSIVVEERYFDEFELMRADELFVTNSIIGIWPLRQIDTTLFRVGRMTTLFQGLLESYQSHEIQDS